MIFKPHLDLKDRHAFLSPSRYHWINYDEDKLVKSYNSFRASAIGVELHAFAAQAIKLGVTVTKNRDTLNMYINDAIGFKMTPEQPLFYSWNCFGTVDAISFRNNTLRIHDLKSGVSRASMDQLYIYAGLFCLEYADVVNMDKLRVELRIYQSGEVFVEQPTIDEIEETKRVIVESDKIISEIKLEV